MASKKQSISAGEEDTIVAIITPPGEGGIAALRLAGRRSLNLLKSHFKSIKPGNSPGFQPFVMRYGLFLNKRNEEIDEVLAVYMPQKKSYTGEQQVEIFCHGGSQAAKIILETLIASGARAAEPGEFTKMAFLSGRIGLTKAEAVAELIGASTEKSYDVARDHLIGNYTGKIENLREKLIKAIAEVEASIDFPEEDIDPDDTGRILNSIEEIKTELNELIASYKGGRIISEGFRIAITGRPNAGKSSLFNLLLRQERALVTPTPGTTRDYLSEWVDLEGFAVNMVDTAGLRSRGGAIERAGQDSTRKIMKQADLIVWMVDLSQKRWELILGDDLNNGMKKKTLLLGNKIDKVSQDNKLNDQLSKLDMLPLSCVTEEGINEFKAMLLQKINDLMPDNREGIVVTSARHKQKLEAAYKVVEVATKKLKKQESPELIAFDLRVAADAIAEITGRIYNEEILGEIFSKFCIGK